MDKSVTFTFNDAWTYAPTDANRHLPISALPEDGLGHIHGRLEIRIAGRKLPCLGYGGEDDVCMGDWLVELHNAASTLSAEDPAEYVYDEGEQGQPAFAFVRRQELVMVSIRDSAISDGVGLPDWQEVECRLTDFVAAVQQLETEFSQLVLAESPAGGKLWLERIHSQMR